jgi:nitrogen fixation-related uncharacterized protein
MTTKRLAPPNVIFAVLVTLSIVVAVVLLYDVYWALRATDDEIMRAAPEDILGFGFWPVWLLLAGIEGVLLTLLYRSAGTAGSRVAAGILVLFVVVSSFAYIEHQRLADRVAALSETSR